MLHFHPRHLINISGFESLDALILEHGVLLSNVPGNRSKIQSGQGTGNFHNVYNSHHFRNVEYVNLEQSTSSLVNKTENEMITFDLLKFHEC